MKIFLEEILPNDDWNGCKVKFFDLKKLTPHLTEFLGYSDTKVPYYNVGHNTAVKKIILKYLTDKMWGMRKFKILTKEWSSYYGYISQPFWNGIKKSKYWLEL